MKQRINLFSKKKQTQPIPMQAVRLRNYGIVTMIVSIIVCIGAGGFYWYQTQELNRLDQEVQQTQRIVNQNDQVQGDVIFFINKKDQLTTFLQDDINFALYYRLLVEIIDGANVEAELKSMNLDESLESSFIITVPSFEDGEPLMEFLESENFLQYFDALTMNSFRVGTRDTLELQFRGTFVSQEDPQQSPDDGTQSGDQADQS